jgi:hypothetical protein
MIGLYFSFPMILSIVNQTWLPEKSSMIPSGKLSHNYGKIHHFIAGKINYFDWAMFNGFLYVYQRVIGGHGSPSSNCPWDLPPNSSMIQVTEVCSRCRPQASPWAKFSDGFLVQTKRWWFLHGSRCDRCDVCWLRTPVSIHIPTKSCDIPQEAE